MQEFPNVIGHLNQYSGAYTTLVTLLLAALTAVYVWLTKSLVREAQQERESHKQLQEQQLRQDLYEKRLAVYQLIIRFLKEFGRDAEVTRNRANQFRRESAQAEFLFGPEVSELVEQIYRKAYQWCDDKARLAEGLPPEHPRRQQVAEDLSTVDRWLCEEAFDLANAQFHPYLKLW